MFVFYFDGFTIQCTSEVFEAYEACFEETMHQLNINIWY